jgi:hypothetical protein
MSKKIALSIPEPCHQNWNSMSPSEKGKFCSSCQKEVIDFSTMNDRQLALFFTKPGGSVCGRFESGQLERPLVVAPKRVPWANYFFTLLLPAYMVSLKASAQKGRLMGRVVPKLMGQTCEPPKAQVTAEPLQQVKHIKGKVIDEQGAPVAGATIMIKGTAMGTSSDSAGLFKLDSPVPGVITLLVSRVGYGSLEAVANDNIEIQLFQLRQPVMGDVVIVGAVVRRPVKPIPLMTRNEGILPADFRVYPNPVKAGGQIRLQGKVIDKGRFTIQLVNTGGEIIFLNEVDSETKTLETAILQATTPGHYLLMLRSNKTRKVYTQKIIVEAN